MRKDIRPIKTDQTELKENVGLLQDENRRLRKRLDNMEGQSRRNNMIVRGVPEKDGGNESCPGGLRASTEGVYDDQAGDGG